MNREEIAEAVIEQYVDALRVSISLGLDVEKLLTTLEAEFAAKYANVPTAVHGDFIARVRRQLAAPDESTPPDDSP